MISEGVRLGTPRSMELFKWFEVEAADSASVLRFTKMQGTGNDFLVLVNQKEPAAGWAAVARWACQRHFGVGADGLLLIEKPSSSKAVCTMRVINSDGSEGGMCGNGLRCVAKLVFDSALRHGHKDRALVIDTGRGPMPITICDADEKGEAQIVQVDMRVPLLEAQLIPCTKPGGVATELSLELRPGGKAAMQFIAIGNGVPHCVVFIDTLKIEEQGKPEKTFSTVDDVPVHLLGPSIEQLSHLFPKRTNVEFVQVVNESSVIQRTWERGAGETLACGSGSCATVVAGILSKRLRASSEKPVTVRLRGGELNISWAGPDSPVLMKGPAKTVYQGQLNLCPPPWPSA